MDSKHFNEVVRAQIEFNYDLLAKKGEEYSEKAMHGEGDRLLHFKKHAALMGRSEKEAVFSMLCKHIISLSEMIYNDSTYTLDTWTEKISDSINYLLILKAVLIENDDFK